MEASRLSVRGYECMGWKFTGNFSPERVCGCRRVSFSTSTPMVNSLYEGLETVRVSWPSAGARPRWTIRALAGSATFTVSDPGFAMDH